MVRRNSPSQLIILYRLLGIKYGIHTCMGHGIGRFQTEFTSETREMCSARGNNESPLLVHSDPRTTVIKGKQQVRKGCRAGVAGHRAAWRAQFRRARRSQRNDTCQRPVHATRRSSGAVQGSRISPLSSAEEHTIAMWVVLEPVTETWSQCFGNASRSARSVARSCRLQAVKPGRAVSRMRREEHFLPGLATASERAEQMSGEGAGGASDRAVQQVLARLGRRCTLAARPRHLAEQQVLGRWLDRFGGVRLRVIQRASAM